MANNTLELRTFIAFDFGTKRIGVAVGQAITLSANPLNPIPAQKGIPDWHHIQVLIEQWHPAGFIVGIPLNVDNTTQAMTTKAKNFAFELRERFQLPIHEVDERLTTIEARQLLYELGGYKALQEISVDSFAAKLILETWLRNYGKDPDK